MPATVALRDVVAVRTGQATAVFKRFTKKWGGVASRCFSLVTSDGLTLDVAMASEEEAQLWIAAITAVLPRTAGATHALVLSMGAAACALWLTRRLVLRVHRQRSDSSCGAVAGYGWCWHWRWR